MLNQVVSKPLTRPASPWGLSVVQRIGPVDPGKSDFRHRLLGSRPAGTQRCAIKELVMM